MYFTTRRSCLAGLLSICGSAAALSQTAPATPAPKTDGDAIVLTPFEISAAKDDGYAATETLAGTRMRTSLSDTSASMSILTPEFMQDLAVTSFTDALLYTPSVDSGESGGNLRFGGGQAYTLRGFSTNNGDQTSSADFFSAKAYSDNYNLERVTLSRGPNSLLFGVGGAQGNAEQSIKHAKLAQARTSINARVDRYSGTRLSLDHNQPLIKNKLALRLNALADNKRGFRDEEGGNQKRIMLGMTAQPFVHTTIKVEAERYDVRLNIAPLVSSFDAGALTWVAAGRPAITFQNPGQLWVAGATYRDANGNSIIYTRNNAITQVAGQSPTFVTGLNLPNPVINQRYQGNLVEPVFGGSTGNYQARDPWALYGLSKNANLYSGTLKNPSQRQDGSWTHLVVEQKLAGDLFLELGANWLKHTRNFDPDSFNNISIDVNRYLPDGSANPGYLVPYSEVSGQYRYQNNMVEEYRATLSYELNLNRFNKWLGGHNFALLTQNSQDTFDQDVMRLMNRATVGLTGWSPTAVNAVHYIPARAYFVNGVVPELPGAGYLIRNVAQINSYGKMVGAGTGQQGPLNYALFPQSRNTKSQANVTSYSFGMQNKWLKDRLVTLYGIRKDRTASYAAEPLQTLADPAVAGSGTTTAANYFNRSETVPLNPVPSVVASGISKTYGAVLHAAPWLSFIYSESNNFLPVGNAAWTNAQGVPAPNSRGVTRDYGVRFYLLNRRLSIGLNKYTNSATNQSSGAAANAAPARGILARLRSNYQNAGDPYFASLAPAGVYPADNTNLSDTSSFDANGYEMNLTFNPSRNLRMALSGSITTNVVGPSRESLDKYLASTDQPFQGIATWKTYIAELQKIAGGASSSIFSMDPNSAANRTLAAADAAYIQTQVTSLLNAQATRYAFLGTTTANIGKYALNGLATYTFSESKLKGLSLGGNFRWRSANAAGYVPIYDSGGIPTALPDVSRPLAGKAFLELGALVGYRWRSANKHPVSVQLNIQNLLNTTATRVTRYATDTNGVYGTVNDLVSVAYQIRRPRNFVLSATFEL